MAVATDHGHSGFGDAQLRTNYVHNSCVGMVESVKGDSVPVAVFRKLIHLETA